MDNNQDYCSYELSKALKAAGFDELCRAFYIPPNKSRTEPLFFCSASTIKNHPAYFCIAAPTLAHAQKWLLEKGGIDVDVRTTKIPKRKYGYVVYDKTQHFSHEEYCAYEQALSAGISAALELINKGE